MNSYQTLIPINDTINNAVVDVEAMKRKLNAIKCKYINTNVLMLLKQIKRNNIKMLLHYTKNVMYKYYTRTKQLDKYNNVQTYSMFYKENISLQNNIALSCNSNNVITRSLVSIQAIQCMLKQSLTMFNSSMHKHFHSMFMNAFNDMYSLFTLHCLMNELDVNSDSIALFMNETKRVFKSTLKQTMLSTFTDNAVKKVKLIVNVHYDDKEFIVRFKKTLIKMKEIWCVYKEYCVMEGKNEWSGKLVKEFINDRKAYYEMVEYYVSKFVKYCNVILKRYAMKELVMIVVGYVCVFDVYVREEGGIGESKSVEYEVRNMVLEQIKYENVNALKKIEVLLYGDIWQRTTIENDIE